MVSVVPLTIIGGLFMIVAYFPVDGWTKIVEPWLPLLQVPVTATFGLLGVFVSFAIGYDLGRQLKQEAIVSASIATVVFLLVQIQQKDQTLSMACAPAPANIANQMYVQGFMTKLIAQCTQGGMTIAKAIDWGVKELEGYQRT